jgi:hypothetical protein
MYLHIKNNPNRFRASNIYFNHGLNHLNLICHKVNIYSASNAKNIPTDNRTVPDHGEVFLGSFS